MTARLCSSSPRYSRSSASVRVSSEYTGWLRSISRHVLSIQALARWESSRLRFGANRAQGGSGVKEFSAPGICLILVLRADRAQRVIEHRREAVGVPGQQVG